jgi:hypothetical protein
MMLVLSFGWFGSVKPSGERPSGYDLIRRRIIRFSDMILAPTDYEQGEFYFHALSPLANGGPNRSGR